MRVVIAPDSFGGTLRASEAASWIAEGWRRVRPDDELVMVPLSDGGEGLLDVLHGAVGGDRRELEVVGPHGKPVRAAWLMAGETAYVESAEAAGLHRLPEDVRTPVRTTTYGVGQVLEAARYAGARRIVVGLGGSATVDAGAGALTALGMRLLRDGGNGLKVGGGQLRDLRAIDRGWLDDAWDDIDVACWADVQVPLDEAAARFGPQKGASADDVALLGEGLRTFAEIVERDLGIDPALRTSAGSGAAGGLGYGLAAGLGASLVLGAPHVAETVGLPRALADADLVITGEGTLDSTSLVGKVVGHVRAAASDADVPVAAVVGRRTADVPLDVEEASPHGPGETPGPDVADAAARLAERSA